MARKNDRPTYPKSHCYIIGCERWSRKFEPGVEWLCGPHWRMAPKRLKRRIFWLERRMKKAGRWRGTREYRLIKDRIPDADKDEMVRQLERKLRPKYSQAEVLEKSPLEVFNAVVGVILADPAYEIRRKEPKRGRD